MISLRLVASLEKKALLELVGWETCLWKSKYSAFFSSESFLLWISSFVAVQGFENDEKASIEALSQSGVFSLIEKLLMAFILAFHGLQSWLFLSEECHEAKALPKISSFPEN